MESDTPLVNLYAVTTGNKWFKYAIGFPTSGGKQLHRFIHQSSSIKFLESFINSEVGRPITAFDAQGITLVELHSQITLEEALGIVAMENLLDIKH